jgi:hypothetical protein
MSNPTNASGDGATPNPDPGVTPNPAASATPAAMTPEQMQAEIKRLTETLDATRKESIQHRTKLTAFEKAQAEAEQAKLDDVQRAAKRAEEAEAKVKEYQEKLMTTQVKLAAQAMNFTNPDLAARLITVDADASDTDITKALQALAQSDPYLIKSPDAAPPATPTRQASGNPPRGGTNPPAPAPFDPRNPPSLQTIWNKPKQ